MRRLLQKEVFHNNIFQFLISYMLMLVLPLLVVSFGFQVAFRIVEDNLKVTHINMLQRSADVVENELVDTESIALQIANSADVLEMAEKRKGDKDYILTAIDALDTFSLYLNYKDIDLLNSKNAYIYFRNTDLVLYERSYYKPEIFQSYLSAWGIAYDSWKESMTDASLMTPLFRRMGDGFEYVFPFSKQMFGEREGVIVLRIDESAVFNKMQFINDLTGRDTYQVEILDAEGEQLWCSDTQEPFPQLEPQELQTGYVEKNGMSIIAVQSEKLGWYYVLALPVKESMSQLLTLQRTVLFLMLLAVAGGIFAAVTQSIRKGKPVDVALKVLSDQNEEDYSYRDLGTAVSDIVSRHKDMLEEIEQDKPSLRKTFFHDLLKAEFSNEAQLRAAAQKAGINLEQQIYQTVYIQLFAENDFYSVDDQTLNEMHVLHQLIMAHLQELCEDKVWFYKRNYSTTVAIFALDDIEADAYQLVQETKDWVLRKYQVEVSWGIGGTCEDLLLIWRSTEEAKIALENCTRLNPIVRYHPELINSEEFYLPDIAQEKLGECLRSGQWQETKDILALLETENCVNRHLHRKQFIKLNQKLMDVLGEVWKQEELKERAFWINEVLMQPEISRQEYFQRLRQLCRKICNDNVEKKQEQRSRMVEEIKEYIEAHYCESDMCLTRVGSEFRVSESYLSTLFKEYSGSNFGDFLEKLRIEKACQLLQDRSITVNEVSEKVGYNSVQSFRRAFKRVKGVSPKELRGSEEQ